jgi:TonB family protein
MYRVLIVDDERMIRDLISHVLRLKGHECDQASDGVEALDKVNKMEYDVLIVDVVMPKMDGYMLLGQVRKQAPDLPVMIMTGFNRLTYLKEPIHEEVFRAGANDFVSKPFLPSEFSARFERMMASNQVLLDMKARQKEIERRSSEMIAAIQKEAMKKIEELKNEYQGTAIPGTRVSEAETTAIEFTSATSAPMSDKRGAGQKDFSVKSDGAQSLDLDPAERDDPKRNGYYRQIKQTINANWHVPEERPDLLGLETEISFTVERTGKINEIRFRKKSGNSYYDKISFQALKKSDPFPPIPSEIPDDRIEISISFNKIQSRAKA